METTNGAKHRCLNELAPEVARHQKVTDRAIFEFNSRRLHQPSRAIQAKVVHRSAKREGGPAQ